MKFADFLNENVDSNTVTAAVVFTDLDIGKDDPVNVLYEDDLLAGAKSLIKYKGISDSFKGIKILSVEENKESYNTTLNVYISGKRNVVEALKGKVDKLTVYKFKHFDKQPKHILTHELYDIETTGGVYDFDSIHKNFLDAFDVSLPENISAGPIVFTSSGKPMITFGCDTKEDLEKFAEKADFFYSDFSIE